MHVERDEETETKEYVQQMGKCKQPAILGEGPWGSCSILATFQRVHNQITFKSFKENPQGPRVGPWHPKLPGKHLLAGSACPGQRGQEDPGCWAPQWEAGGQGAGGVREGCRRGAGHGDTTLTFFILKDSSSSLSTARMFSMGMLHRGWSPVAERGS